jgi:hypothetical protein
MQGRLWRALGLLLLLSLMGCGGGDGLVELSGRVALDGAPVERGTIQFEPADGVGPSAEATITAGAYRAPVSPGVKKVRIYAYKKIGEYHVTGPDSPLIDEVEQIAPAKFNDDTTLEREVPARGLKTLDFELSSDA